MEAQASAADDRVVAARAALDRHEWGEALLLLRAADGDGPLAAADLDLLGEAAMWAGHVDECLAAWESAYAGHVKDGDRLAAAATALRLVRESWAKGDDAIARGWYRRASRILEDEPECSVHGYLAQVQWFGAMEREDWDEAVRQAERMVEIGAGAGEADLQALGLSRQGNALVSRGDVEGGLALLDEATAAAVAGELGPYATFVVYCAAIAVCRDLTDYRRAAEWTQAARRWCERRAVSGFPGVCRVYHAEILRLRGDWEAAERDVREACGELQGAGWNTVAGAGFCELGEIRLRIGDLAGAEDAFSTAYGLGRDPQPGLALVRLAQGRADDAGAALAQALAERPEDLLRRARLLPVAVEVALARGDTDVAERAAGELDEIAASFDTSALHAASACARAAVALAHGDGEAALRCAREGLRLWQEIELPYEAARARLLVADALGLSGEHDAAALELRTAHAAFVRLGAARDAKAAGERLRPETDSPPAVAGAAITRTFMFTDVVSSTDLIGVIGDDAWAAARGWHDVALRAHFAAAGGEEISHAGDGFFVAFSEPGPAIACAVEIQRSLERHRREQGFALPVRIGVHTAAAAQTPDGYAGRGVHEAARIGALAAAGEILASAATLGHAPAGIDSEPTREVSLKGLDKPLTVAAIHWH
ncbi:MAG TPA: adenylate/guanylate cyclase domain-containing protein [Solirubrobacteraceae bacterium]|nr:adenylate/guanylate cyclase domain-containing protein [Solirubrobacteraceae bacterium]